MSELVIRRAVRADLSALPTLLDEADELHRRALPWLFRQVEGIEQTAFREVYLSDPAHAVFLAQVGADSFAGVIYAFLRPLPRAPIVRPATVAEIDLLVVKSSVRRQGIGKRLVSAALDWANQHGASRTELGVYEFNEPARAFWASLGFAPLSSRLVRHANGA